MPKKGPEGQQIQVADREGYSLHYQKAWATKHRTTLEGGAPPPLAAVCFPSIAPRAAIYQNTKYRLVYDSSIPRYPKEVKAGSPAGPVFIAEAAM